MEVEMAAKKKEKPRRAASSRTRGAESRRKSKPAPDAAQTSRTRGEQERAPTPADMEALRDAPPIVPPGEASLMFRPFEAMVRTASAFAGLAMGTAMGAMIGATRGAIEGGRAGLERQAEEEEQDNE
jgi:hypothetical protein